MTRMLAVVVVLCGLWSVLHVGDDYNVIRAHRFDSPRAWEVWLDRLGTMRGEPQVARARSGSAPARTTTYPAAACSDATWTVA